MTDTETHTVETAFGPAEVETLECDSCGNRVAAENTVPFTIGNTDGRACEHCEATGPVSFPRRTLEFVTPTYVNQRGKEYSLWFHIGAFPVIVFFGVVSGLFEDSDEFHDGYSTAAVSFLVWGALLALLFGT